MIDTKFKIGQSPWNKGKENYWMKGKPRPDNVRQKISQSRLGKSYPNKRKGTCDIKKNCINCGVSFTTIKSKSSRNFCSKQCYSIHQKNNIIYNKGIFKAKTYGAYHHKVRRLRGTPSLCEICGTTHAKKFEWANLTGHYDDINDYKRMCTSCHSRFDNKILNITGIQV